MLLYPPLGPLSLGRRFNATLHGRSRFRPADVPGHNVFNGYTRPGWGDAVDLFCPPGAPVYALEDCRQVLHRNDATRLEVIYLQGERYLAVLAHVNAVRSGSGHRFGRGDVVAHVRADLQDPHLHLELARGQRGSEEPLAGQTPAALIVALTELIVPPPLRVVEASSGTVLGEVPNRTALSARIPGYRIVPAGDHQRDQGKLYVAAIRREE